MYDYSAGSSNNSNSTNFFNFNNLYYMANSILSAYWKWRIIENTEIEKFGLTFKFQKSREKNEWEIQVRETESFLKVLSAKIEVSGKEDLTVEISKICLRLMDEIYKPNGKLNKFFENQYKLWK